MRLWGRFAVNICGALYHESTRRESLMEKRKRARDRSEPSDTTLLIASKEEY